MTDRNSKKNVAAGSEIKALRLGEKILTGITLALLLLMIWFMRDVALLSFILGFIFFFANKYLRMLLSKLPFRVPYGLSLTLVYLVGLGIIGMIATYLGPMVFLNLSEIAGNFRMFNISDFFNSLDPKVAELLRDIDWSGYIQGGADIIASYAGKTGSFGLNFLLAILISYLVLLEKDKLLNLGKLLENSRAWFVYKYSTYFARNFFIAFSTVMKVQILIALINSVLSMCALAILGFKTIFGLGLMIFFLGLIPVAGVIISLVPLSIMAFNMGGLPKVAAVLIMVIVLHALEAYILNPKLMSNRTALPVSLVVIILLVSEHYVGIWGLLIGVPLFIFALRVFDVDYDMVVREKNKKIRPRKIGRKPKKGVRITDD
jgi:predicted PurR-regulated permease PerM